MLPQQGQFNWCRYITNVNKILSLNISSLWAIVIVKLGNSLSAFRSIAINAMEERIFESCNLVHQWVTWSVYLWYHEVRTDQECEQDWSGLFIMFQNVIIPLHRACFDQHPSMQSFSNIWNISKLLVVIISQTYINGCWVVHFVHHVPVE